MKRVIPDQYTQYTCYQSARKKKKGSAETVRNIKFKQTYNRGNLGENTEKLVEACSEVADSNMKMAAKKIHSFNSNNSDVKSLGLNFDWTMSSRGWQAKEGVAAAIAQKIIGIVRKTTYSRDC